MVDFRIETRFIGTGFGDNPIHCSLGEIASRSARRQLKTFQSFPFELTQDKGDPLYSGQVLSSTETGGVRPVFSNRQMFCLADGSYPSLNVSPHTDAQTKFLRCAGEGQNTLLGARTKVVIVRDQQISIEVEKVAHLGKMRAGTH